MPGCACHVFLPWTAFQLPGVFSLLLHLAIVIRLHLLHAYWIGQRVACIFLFLVGIGFGHFPGLLCPCSSTLSNNTLDSQLSHLVLSCLVLLPWLHPGRCSSHIMVDAMAWPSSSSGPVMVPVKGCKKQGRETSGILHRQTSFNLLLLTVVEAVLTLCHSPG